MVKLVSTRTSRLYGPGGYRELFEGVNAVVYVFGAVLLLAGLIFQLPNHDTKLGLTLALIGSVLIFLVNLHDLYAHLAGVEFKMELLRMDPQFLLVEFAVPLVSAIGSFIVFLAILFLLVTSKGRYSMHTKDKLVVHALRMLIAGPALWLLASIHNIFQVYERASLSVQAYARGVSVCFVIGSTLLLCGGVIGLPYWPKVVMKRLQLDATWFAIAGAAVLVLASMVNVMRVAFLQRVEQSGGYGEPLRGGAEESLRRLRVESSQPFLEGSAKQREDIEGEGGAGRALYKDVVAASPERLY